MVPFARAEPGIIGLQTALSLVLELVAGDRITLRRAIELLSVGPSGVLGRIPPALRVGAAADLVVFDPSTLREFSAEEIVSKSKNSPFIGATLTGNVRATFVGGALGYASPTVRREEAE